MAKLSELRRWINRDNGRLYQADNRNLGALEAVGLFLLPAAMLLWYLHPKLGISSYWAVGLGLCGVLLLAVDWIRSRKELDA